jgi:putative drug exporter of the RND superfamily
MSSTQSDHATRPGFVQRKPRTVLVTALVIMIASLGIGVGAFQFLSGGGFDVDGTESVVASETLQDEFDAGESDAVFLVDPAEGDVDTPEATAAGLDLTEELRADPDVVRVTSYWENQQVAGLRSNDGSAAIVVVQLKGSQNEKSTWLREAHDKFDAGDGKATIKIGGNAEVFRAIQDQITEDLIVAEAIAVPLSMLLLLIVFRSVMAALLPLFMGALSAAVTMLVLRILTEFTEVSIFSLNLISGLALGLGIDYGLLMVTRFREELAAGRDVDEAISRTMRTAGRTVVFSGITVALSLGTLLLFPMTFLRSFGYTAIPVVGVSVLGAIIVLPALLKVLGHKVEKWPLRWAPPLNPSEPTWERMARFTIRHRFVVAIVGVVGLGVLAIPFLHVNIGKSDDRVLPENASVRAVQQEIRDKFPGNAAFPVDVYLPGLGRAAEDRTELNETAAELSRLEHVGIVRGGDGMWQDGALVAPVPALAQTMSNEDNSYLQVLLKPEVEVYSTQASETVDRIRAIGADQGARVGGESARLVDNKDVIGDRLPLALGLIVLFTFILVFLLTGSVVMPVKALFLNLLSLTATFGVMVWGFQDGNLEGLLGFTSSGYLDNAMPVLMFCAAFGLSMDYELFLISRIREEYLRTGDNNLAVVEGIKKTGAVFTSAALLLAVVFAGLIASKVSIIQMAGLGIVLAILVDAVLIRTALVPALMGMMGKANWWAPGFLRRLHTKVHFSDEIDDPDRGDTAKAKVSTGAVD